MATIEKRKTNLGTLSYRAKVRLRGFPPQTATFERLTDAKRWVQDTESAIREGRYFKTVQAKKYTFAETVDRYIEIVLNVRTSNTDNQRAYLKFWRLELGHYILADINPGLLVTSRSKLVGKENQFGRTISPSTANRYMEALSHVFSVAINEWNWLDTHPVQKIKKFKEPRGIVRMLSDNERTALLRECKTSDNPHLYTIVILALSTGARKNEVVRLKWDDIDLPRMQMTFHETKNTERRTIPFRGKALQMIEERAQLKDSTCPFVFPSELNCQPIDIKRAWQNAIIRSGVKDFRFHDLRHSAASYLAMNGATLTELAGVLGHKTLQMVKRYAHLTEAHTHSVVDSMNERFLSDV